MRHEIKLLAPWYVCERGEFDRFDPRALAPAIQKYDTPDFVERLLKDPRDSLKMRPEDGDVWSYPVPVAEADRGGGRLRFATHRLCPTDLRKLYQPNHDRFYAVVVELYCDAAGLPRLSPADGIKVSMVLRRRSVVVTGRPAHIRRVARDLTRQMLAASHQGANAGGRPAADVDDVLWTDLTVRRRFEQEHAGLLSKIGVRLDIEAWMVGNSGAEWRRVGAPPPAGTTDTELELPMWPIPARDKDCQAARTRSLWFGIVPTFSGDHDRSHQPKLDDRAIYEICCVARREQGPGREHCPPQEAWSKPSEAFRLAAFLDPEGTKNKVFSIRMPDFRAVAARAGQPAGPGGVAISSPPGSQMFFDPNDGSPKGGQPPDGTPGGICTFALEIFMIVAFFVFSLFLPIVVLLFQLWWLLALRFCLPPMTDAVKTLTAFFGTTGKSMANVAPAGQTMLDALLGTKGMGAALADKDSGFPVSAGSALVGALDADKASKSAQVTPDTMPSDPLCPPGPATQARLHDSTAAAQQP